MVVPKTKTHVAWFFFHHLMDLWGQFLQDCGNVVTTYDTSAGSSVYDCQASSILGSSIQLTHQAGGITGPSLQMAHVGRSMALPGHHVFGCLEVILLFVSPFIVTLYPTFIYPHLIKPWRLVEGQTVGQELDGFGTDVLRNTKVSLGRMLGKILYMKTFLTLPASSTSSTITWGRSECWSPSCCTTLADSRAWSRRFGHSAFQCPRAPHNLQCVRLILESSSSFPPFWPPFRPPRKPPWWSFPWPLVRPFGGQNPLDLLRSLIRALASW